MAKDPFIVEIVFKSIKNNNLGTKLLSSTKNIRIIRKKTQWFDLYNYGMKQQISYQMGDGHIVNKKSQVPEGFDYFVFEDLEQSFVFQKESLDSHYDYVMSSLGNSYKGVNKYVYGNTLSAIKTIVNCKKQHSRRTENCKEAIAFLHQDMQLATNSIQNILRLFGVKLSTMQILRDSEQVLSDREPDWVQRIFGGIN